MLSSILDIWISPPESTSSFGSSSPGIPQRLQISSIGPTVSANFRHPWNLPALALNNSLTSFIPLGGPGASSATGLLFELGPCKVAAEDGTVARNKYSWNTHSNILFLDQPVNVGWSYSDDGSRVSRSHVAGEDVYAFFQLFFSRFPEYAEAKFHMAAESYGGTYAPNAAAVFHKKNRELEVTPVPGLTKINLASVILANGWTNPIEQYSSIPDWICEGPYALFGPESRECKNLRRSVSRCRRFAEACYKFDTRLTCAPAETYCSYALENLVSSRSCPR